MEDNTEPPSKRKRVEELEESPSLVEINPKDKHEDRDFTQDVDASGEKFMCEEDKYSNYVNPEELERLREFKVLDEVHSNDDDSNDEDSDSSDGKSDVPEEEIEKMLEEDLPEDFKGAPKPKEKPYITIQKVVLEEKGVNQFEVLPLDWMMVRHYSGMPVYMHRATRVCTLSKPYFLGKGNTKRHDIPISAIPCLAYRRALEEEEKQKEIDKQIEEQIKNGTWQQNVTNNKTQTNKPTNRKTDSKSGEQHSSENKSRCPHLHAKGIVQNSNEMPENHEYLKANVRKNDENSSEATVGGTNEDQISETNQNKLIEIEINVCKNETEPVINSDENGLTNETNLESQEIKIELEQACERNKELNSVSNNQAEKLCTDNPNIDIEIGSKEDNPLVNNVSNNTTETLSEKESDVNVVTSSESQEIQEQNGDPNNDNRDNNIPLNRQPVVLPGGIVMPPPRVETVSTSWKSQHLTHEQVNEYCKSLFKFKTVNIMHFKRWADRRKYTKARKALQYPTLPEGTKLITIPSQSVQGQENNTGKANKRDWVMSMNGRSYLSVFHEYVRRALQKQPVYEFKQLENAATPYQATVYIGGMQYGVGHGSSKRAAKSAAARASIHILIPEMAADLDSPTEPDFTFFDYVGIEDPRITEFCAATCEPSPHAILRTCLLRNFGAGDKHIHTEMKKLEYQKISLTMKVGKHSATVVCKNKKTAKQRASQAILQALHPHVRSWGSLLRLYGSRSVKSCKEKKLEEQQITLLQDAAKHNEPNYAVLDKLRHEMRKLRERDAAVVPIGTLLVRDTLPTHSGSNLNNVDL